MRRAPTITELRELLRPARRAGRTIGLVPTMGALHDGHLALVRAATAASDVVVVSVFVNPAQFGPGEDLDAYPRDLGRDEALLGGLDPTPAVVFAPAVAEMYPRPRLTTVSVEEMTGVLCGRSRPGHFDGVTTVVAKLLNIVQPDAAWFGRKDYQQLAVIRRMVADLDVPVAIHGVPTVRESDGVALSSRNAYLDAGQRHAARALSQGLRAAVLADRQGREHGAGPDAGVLRTAAGAILERQPDVRVDYVEVLDPDTLEPPDGRLRGRGEGPGSAVRRLVAVAAHVGPARLIDNVVVGDRDDEDRLLDATTRPG